MTIPTPEQVQRAHALGWTLTRKQAPGAGNPPLVVATSESSEYKYRLYVASHVEEFLADREAERVSGTVQDGHEPGNSTAAGDSR